VDRAADRGEERAVDTNTRNGQAFVELIIGIIVIVIILAGGIQFFYVSNAHRSLTTTVRGEVGEQALSGIPYISTPPYIFTWDDGNDDIRHTDDDTPITGSAQTLTTIADRSVSDPADWDRLDPLSHDNAMPLMHESQLPTTELSFIESSAPPVTIVVDPAVRTFLFDRPTVTVRHSIWMPLLGGIY
jgi:hypothetical protein